jgi:hypothetical protein
MRRTRFLQTVIVIILIICTASVAFAADLNSFFGNSTFGFPPLLKDVKFGMSESEIQRVVPDFKGDFSFKVKGNEEIEVAKDMSFGSLFSIRINFPRGFQEVIPYLQQKWGKPITVKDLIGIPVYHWLSKTLGMRAELRKDDYYTELSYFRYIPFETLFPENVPTLPAQLKGVKIGSPLSSLKNTGLEFKPGVRSVDLKGYFDVTIWYLADKSTIKYFTVSFPTVENVRNILIKKWGTPAKSVTGKEYWQNKDLEYVDEKGNIQKGIFVVYNSQPAGFHHSVDFTPVLKGYKSD